MSKTIATIYGVIVDNFYDDGYFDDIIAKGVITPASRFIYQVASAQGDLEVRVNSFGGDVFAANSMIIALRAWAANHPKASLDIVVESAAMSAAANFIAMAPKSAKVSAYGTSLIMYHSCSTITWGGPGAHKDAATLMDKINGAVKSALSGKTTLDAGVIDEWFQEGRQGWLSADDAKKCHLIDSIADGEPEPMPEPPEEALEDKKIAAFYSGQQSLLAAYNTNITGAATMPTAEDEDNRNKEEEEKKDNPEQEGTEEEEEKKDNPEQEGTEEEEEEKKDDDVEQKASARVEQLEKEVADLKAQLEASQKTIAKLTAGFRGKTSAAGGQTSASFADKVKALKDAKPSDWDAQFLALKKSDPTGFAEFMKSVH